MIFCINKPKEEYVVRTQGLEIGPYKHYRNRPGMFSMMSFFSPILFQWEEGSPVPELSRIYNFAPHLEILYEQCLDTEVMGRTLLNWLGGLKSIEQFTGVFAGYEFNSIPLTKFYSPGQIRLIFDARVASTKSSLTKSERDKIMVVKENAYGEFAKSIH